MMESIKATGNLSYKLTTLESLFVKARKKDKGILATTEGGLRILIFPSGEYMILSGNLK